MLKTTQPLVGVTILAVLVGLVAGLMPAGPVAAQGLGDCVNTHVVFDGETLSEIAKTYGVDMNELAALNNIENPSRIFIGDVLCLDGLVEAQPSPDGDDDGTTTATPTPTAGPVATADPDATPAPTTPPVIVTPPPVTGNANFEITVAGQTYRTDNQGYYTVQPGDNLYRITLAFGLNQERLMAVNGITTPNHLLIGTRLLIPTSAPDRPAPGTIPGLAIVPRVAGPGDEVTVQGYNYPANSEVEIYFEKQRENRISDVITTVTTDENGTFELELEIIDEWTNGDPVDSRTVSISGYSVDEPEFWAMNFFINTAFE